MRTPVTSNFSDVPPLKSFGKHYPAPPTPQPVIPPPATPLDLLDVAIIQLARALPPDVRKATDDFLGLFDSTAYQLGDQYEQAELASALMAGWSGELRASVMKFFAATETMKRRWNDKPTEREPDQPDPDDFRVFYSPVMSGAVYYNAIKPKLRSARWRVTDTNACSGDCRFCGASALVQLDWQGPDYDEDDGQIRSFIICPECDHTTEELFIRNCDPLPTDQPLYIGCPLTDADAAPVNQDGQ